MTYTGKTESRIGTLYGANLDDRTNVVVGVEYNWREKVYPEDMPLADGVLRLTTPWQPANFLLPTRNAAGDVMARPSIGASRRLDTGCGTIVQTKLIGSTCYYDFGPDNVSLLGEGRLQAMTRMSHEFSKSLRFHSELGFGDVHTQGTSSSSSSINVSTPITVPGDNPGNPYSAVNSTNQPLYAVPDPNNPAAPLRIPNSNTTLYPLGQVVLMGTPTVQNSAVPSVAVGLGVSPTATGIPFKEDVTLNGRILGSQGGLPTNNTIPAGAFARSHPYDDHSRMLRVGGGLDGQIGDSSWQWSISANFSRIAEINDAQANDVLTSNLRLAVQGWGGSNCNPLAPGAKPGQGNCYYFNPFTSAIYATPGTPAANRQDVISWMTPQLWDQFDTSLVTYDAVLNGELFDLPAGPVAVAVGGQYRNETWSVDFDAEKNSGNVETGAVSNDVDKGQIARAIFAQLSVPVVNTPNFGSLNFNGALRHENSGGGIQTTDPKLGFLYKTPNKMLSLRGSWGTSFLAPSLFEKYTSSSGLAQINDDASGGTGEQVRRITTLISGNPNLKPQTAVTDSLGFTLQPLRNLSFDFDYWHYKYDQLIALENTQQLVTQNVAGKVIRDSGNNVIFVLPSYVNVSSLETSGIDLEADYSLDIGRFGTLTSTTMATWTGQMDVRSTPTGPVVNVNDSNAAIVTGAPPNLKWRALSRLNWHLGPHEAALTFHFNGRYGNELISAPPGYVKNPSADAALNAFGWADLQYTYTLKDFWGASSMGLTVGAQNVLNSKPDVLVGGTSALFVDNRLRIVYLRLRATF